MSNKYGISFDLDIKFNYMLLLKLFTQIYLAVGLSYSIYILLKGYNKWYWAPINVVLGPLIIAYSLYVIIKNKVIRINL